jgi:hypothetical protein
VSSRRQEWAEGMLRVCNSLLSVGMYDYWRFLVGPLGLTSCLQISPRSQLTLRFAKAESGKGPRARLARCKPPQPIQSVARICERTKNSQ